MRQIREYSLAELGHFTERQCEAIRATCEGTYMNIRVSWSNYAGNCTLLISSDYGSEEMTYEESQAEVKAMFLNRALGAIWTLMPEDCKTETGHIRR